MAIGFAEAIGLFVRIYVARRAARLDPIVALRHGLPEYWLVDPQERTIRQYALLGTPYIGGRFGEPAMPRDGDLVTSPLFPTVSAPLTQLFQHVRSYAQLQDP